MSQKRKKRYPSNLSEGAWRCLKPLLPVSAVGRPRQVRLRQVVNAILYVLKTGCQWRQLPREFPAWAAVYYYFYRWTQDGMWARLNHTLRSRLRQQGGRHKHPTGACLDSQSVKCTAVPGVRGYDAGKQINGRKRHILVDTLGLLLAVTVTRASVPDRDGARWLLRHLPGGGAKRREKLSRVLGKSALKSFHPRSFNPRLFAGATRSDQSGTHRRTAAPAFC